MSKRAKDAALKAYPTHKGASKEWIKHYLLGGDCAVFIKGYEQAEKDTIERIISYLSECDLDQTILDFDRDGYATIHFESLEKLIRKAMEEE